MVARSQPEFGRCGSSSSTTPVTCSARVLTYNDPACAIIPGEKVVNQQKRDTSEVCYANSSSHFVGWRWKLASKRVQEMIEAGTGSQYIVPANDSDGYYL